MRLYSNRVYLINPPAAQGVRLVREGRCMQREGAWTAVWAPVSLALIGALLERSGFEVRLTDCIIENIDLPLLRKLVNSFQPALVIINAVTPSIKEDTAVSSYLKQALPGLVTAVIGIHGTVLPEETLKDEPALDIVIRGEPENTAEELAKVIKNNLPWDNIEGISYRRDAAIRHNPDRPVIPDLDFLPFPAWHLAKPRLYRLPFSRHPFLLLATSRGCPYPCRFCADPAFYGKRLRLRKPEQIVTEMRWVKDNFGIRDFLFWTESFTINRDFAFSVARAIKDSGEDFRWVCNSRADNVDVDLLRMFKSAGCWMVGYGLESGSPQILEKMKKGITIARITETVKQTKAAGLEVTAHCVLGYPGETEETMRQTLELVKNLPIDFVQFYCAVPFPGSALYHEAKEQGWIINYDWTYFEQNFSVLTTPWLGAAKIMDFRRQAYQEFYLRLPVIFNTLSRLRHPREWWAFLEMVFQFLTWVR